VRVFLAMSSPSARRAGQYENAGADGNNTGENPPCTAQASLRYYLAVLSITRLFLVSAKGPWSRVRSPARCFVDGAREMPCLNSCCLTARLPAIALLLEKPTVTILVRSSPRCAQVSCFEVFPPEAMACPDVSPCAADNPFRQSPRPSAHGSSSLLRSGRPMLSEDASPSGQPYLAPHDDVSPGGTNPTAASTANQAVLGTGDPATDASTDAHVPTAKRKAGWFGLKSKAHSSAPTGESAPPSRPPAVAAGAEGAPAPRDQAAPADADAGKAPKRSTPRALFAFGRRGLPASAAHSRQSSADLGRNVVPVGGLRGGSATGASVPSPSAGAVPTLTSTLEPAPSLDPVPEPVTRVHTAGDLPSGKPVRLRHACFDLQGFDDSAVLMKANALVFGIVWWYASSCPPTKLGSRW
jgi:hypothetical protein